MAVRLRLRRVGKKKMPMYHIVAADSRYARNGKFLEVVGSYAPLQKPAAIAANEERLFYWLNNGARPTDTVRSLLRRKGLWMKWAMKKSGKDESVITKVMERWQLDQDDKAKRDDARRGRRLIARRKKKTAEAPAAPAEAPVQS